MGELNKGDNPHGTFKHMSTVQGSLFTLLVRVYRRCLQHQRRKRDLFGEEHMFVYTSRETHFLAAVSAYRSYILDLYRYTAAIYL